MRKATAVFIEPTITSIQPYNVCHQYRAYHGLIVLIPHMYVINIMLIVVLVDAAGSGVAKQDFCRHGGTISRRDARRCGAVISTVATKVSLTYITAMEGFGVT